jgi:hypothetical protein
MINPPNMARPPVAAFPTAALLVTVAAPPVEELVVVGVLVFVRVVERVTFEDGFELVLEVTVVIVVFALVDEVMVALLEDEVLLYAGPCPSWIVVVEVADPVTEVEVLVDPERPVMWNGKEYWKIVGSESREILKP